MTEPYRLRAQQPSTGPAPADLLGPTVRSFNAAAHRTSIVAITPFVLLLAYVVWLAHQGEILRWFNSNFSATAVTVLLVLSIALIARTSAVGGGELVRLHAGGLLDLRAGPRAVRWDEVESLTVEVAPNGEVVRHVLRTTDGVRLSLGRSIADVDDLVDVIRSRMVDHVAPALRARIASGGELRFGPLAASEAGIALGPRVIPWEELEDVDAEAGELVVRGPAGARLVAARLEEVPNAFLLAEIVHERKRGGRT